MDSGDIGTFPEQYLPPVPPSGELGLEQRHGDNSTEKEMRAGYTGPVVWPLTRLFCAVRHVECGGLTPLFSGAA